MNIQSEPLTNPCMICGGKGTFLLVAQSNGPFVCLNTYLNRDRYKASNQSYPICGHCEGKGEVPAVEMKR